MKNAWENVIYTCSNVLVFEDEFQIDKWSKKNNIPKGDIQSIQRIGNFPKEWYGNHLNPEWTKWAKEEAKEMFEKFELTHRI